MGFDEIKGPADSLLLAGTLKTLEHINDKPQLPSIAPASLAKTLTVCGHDDEEITWMLAEHFGAAARSCVYTRRKLNWRKSCAAWLSTNS
ncbi:hypothetical protein [Bradyrhizobium sp. McL0616]|uniref:hypothetical protein n=1 Tax=Bradyrhizobium sp. McL0616 TaxID=3415674 RepID=UPI003CF10502